MPNENPEIRKENQAGQHVEAGPEFYDLAQKPTEVIRKWATEAERQAGQSVVDNIIEFPKKPLTEIVPAPSDTVARLVAKLRSFKDPIDAFNDLRLRVESKEVDPYDAAEALASKDDEIKDLSKAA